MGEWLLSLRDETPPGCSGRSLDCLEGQWSIGFQPVFRSTILKQVEIWPKPGNAVVNPAEGSVANLNCVE